MLVNYVVGFIIIIICFFVVGDIICVCGVVGVVD